MTITKCIALVINHVTYSITHWRFSCWSYCYSVIVINSMLAEEISSSKNKHGKQSSAVNTGTSRVVKCWVINDVIYLYITDYLSIYVTDYLSMFITDFFYLYNRLLIYAYNRRFIYLLTDYLSMFIIDYLFIYITDC